MSISICKLVLSAYLRVSHSQTAAVASGGGRLPPPAARECGRSVLLALRDYMVGRHPPLRAPARLVLLRRALVSPIPHRLRRPLHDPRIHY